MAASLSSVPIEVLIDNLLPFCTVPDILSLGSTDRFFALVSSDDTFWKRKLHQDFNFTGADTARTTGWKFIYQRLSNPRVFVWGERSKGRLGLNKFPKANIPHDGIPFPVELTIPNVRLVSLVAGGMSFHALDSLGDVYVWGTLDGTSIVLQSDGFSEASKTASTPLKLQLPAMRSISCGRLHSMTLDTNSRIWTFLNWGRPFRVVSPLLDCESLDATPAQIECGWAFSSVLTKSGKVLVFWPFGNEIQSVFRPRMEELDSANESTMAHATEDNQIPCYTWDMTVNVTMLPPLPPLSDLMGSGLDEETRLQETNLIKIAGLDNTLVGLTNKGHVVKFNNLSDENSVANSTWEYLPLFSEVDKVKAHSVFSTSHSAEAKVKFESEHMCITHISANFQTFIAYSTGSTSVVLMGSARTDPESTPTIIPELQNRSIISVVLGDYHYGALTSSGTLYTWGQFSRGALGLGDPGKLKPGCPGGFATEQHRLRAIDHYFGSPPNVEVPTEVRFDHNLKQKRRRFCFAAAAAGWHFGALVIDLDEDEAPSEEVEEEFEEPGVAPRAVRSRGCIHRIGFAGRGIMRGGGV